ncbi:hypothetical protein PTKIN_Ptkin09bG0229800 [Pterospermum kingtungense]
MIQDMREFDVIPVKGAMTNEVFQINWPTKHGDLHQKCWSGFMVKVWKSFSIGIMRLGPLSVCTSTVRDLGFLAGFQMEGLKSSFMPRVKHFQHTLELMIWCMLKDFYPFRLVNIGSAPCFLTKSSILGVREITSIILRGLGDNRYLECCQKTSM